MQAPPQVSHMCALAAPLVPSASPLINDLTESVAVFAKDILANITPEQVKNIACVVGVLCAASCGVFGIVGVWAYVMVAVIYPIAPTTAVLVGTLTPALLALCIGGCAEASQDE